jgi:hypothetical protein
MICTEKTKYSNLDDLEAGGLMPMPIDRLFDFTLFKAGPSAYWVCPSCEGIIRQPIHGCEHCDYPPF